MKKKINNKQLQLRGLSDNAMLWLTSPVSLQQLRSFIEGEAALTDELPVLSWVVTPADGSPIIIEAVSRLDARKLAKRKKLNIKTIKRLSL